MPVRSSLHNRWFRAPHRLHATRPKASRTPACRASRRRNPAITVRASKGWHRQQARRARFYGAWAGVCLKKYGNKARTLTAVLYRAPPMTLNINTIVLDTDALHAQSRALFVPGWAACGQAQSPAGTEYAVPGQFAVAGQLTQCPADPASGASQSRQFGELTITHDLAFGYLRERQVQRRASDLRGTLGFFGQLDHVRSS